MAAVIRRLKHGFIWNQRMGIEVFKNIPLTAKLIISGVPYCGGVPDNPSGMSPVPVPTKTACDVCTTSLNVPEAAVDRANGVISKASVVKIARHPNSDLA